jgi:hypothetical protein
MSSFDVKKADTTLTTLPTTLPADPEPHRDKHPIAVNSFLDSFLDDFGQPSTSLDCSNFIQSYQQVTMRVVIYLCKDI